MAVATLFDSEKSSRGSHGKRNVLRSLLVHGPGGEANAERPVAPPHAAESGCAPEGHGEAQGATDAAPPPRAHDPMTRSSYLRRLEEVIRRTEQAELDETVVEVSPKEVQRLVRKAAKAKARYIAATLDAAEDDKLPDAASIKALQAARERHEAMEAGLQSLLNELRRGNIAVAGIEDDPDTYMDGLS